MARIKNNHSMEGITGKVGNIFVYRHRNGETIVAKTPDRTAPLTEKQKDQTKKFKAAITYAKNALLEPSLKEDYDKEAKKRKKGSAYNLAVADYLNPPIIVSIDHSGYTGGTSDEKITIEVEDDFKVIKVKVKIIEKNKTIIEEGEATLSRGKWQYKTTTVNATLAGSKIIISAIDRPNNITTQEITL